MRTKWWICILLVMVYLSGCSEQEQLMEREQQIVELESENEQLRMKLENTKETYEIQSIKFIESMEYISELENEIKELEEIVGYVDDGQGALIDILIAENKMIYELIDVDRELMNEDSRLKSYMDLRFVEEGDKIGDFIIDEYNTDNERFFRRFAISLTGAIVLKGSFLYISNADYDDIVFQIDESDRNRLPYTIELQNIQYLHVNNYEEFLSQSDIDVLINGSVEGIEKNIEIEKLFISGQLGSDLYYVCNIAEVN